MPTANFKQNTPSGRVLRKREATMQKAMQGKDFKIIRRNSLTAEVDGVWPNLEEEEDSYIPHKVMMKGAYFEREDWKGREERRVHV